MFSLIAHEVLQYKIRETKREDYIAAGMTPFSYAGKGKTIEISYFQVPAEAYDNSFVLQA